MKKKTLYIYRDEPAGIFQIEKYIKMNLILKNFKVKFISSENLFYSKKQIENYFKFTPKKEIPRKISKFRNSKEWEIFLKSVKKDDLFFVFRDTKNNKFSATEIELFKRYNIRTIFLSETPKIEYNFKKSLFTNILGFINDNFVKFIKFFKRKNSFQATFLIGSGELSYKNFLRKDIASNYINLPSYWIDFSKKKTKKNIITYVDESIFYSRDANLNNQKDKRCSNPIKFLNDLNNFFKLLESKTNYEIVIACSKKSFKYTKDIFNKRKIVYGKTSEYISKSRLVLGHSSESLTQAIYNEVPVQCLKHKTFSFKRNYRIERMSSNIFNKNSFFIEDYLEGKHNIKLSIDRRFYKNVLYKYYISKNLKSENFSKKFKIVIEKLG